MLNLLTSPLGRLRLLGLAEGLSLLVLVGVAVPLKHLRGDASLVRVLGPIHGLLFLLYLLNALRVGTEQHWRFAQTTWKVLLASLVPFGTFYIERRVLAPLQEPPLTQVEVLVFKTSVTHHNQVERLRPGLDALGQWNFDLGDCDHILRMETSVPAALVVQLLVRNGFACEELS